MGLNQIYVSHVRRRLRQAGASSSFGRSVASSEIFIRGPLPWSEASGDTERPWTYEDEARGLTWANDSRTFPVCPRAFRLVIREFAGAFRFWPASAPIPVAEAKLMKHRDGTWSWLVTRCPYCRESHRHGLALTDNPRHMLGHHSERCETPIPGARGYYLVEATGKKRSAAPMGGDVIITETESNENVTKQ